MAVRDGLRFAAINEAFGSFGAETHAVCRAGHPIKGSRPHTAPRLSCTCGFYAVPPDAPLELHGEGTVELLVELYGTVIEHELGFRAEWQRVLECRLPCCPFCRRPASGMWFTGCRSFGSCCDEHRGPRPHTERFVSREDLATGLGVQIGDEL